MRLMRVGEFNAEIPIVQMDNGLTFDLRPLTKEIDGSFLAQDGIGRTRHSLTRGELPEVSIEGLRIGAPIARPAAVVCIGQNYAAHAAESGNKPPERPIVFFKHPNTIVGPYDNVFIPPKSDMTDWEVELAVVIGQTVRYTSSPESALQLVAGVCIANDVSEREFQLAFSEGQWSKGKCAETFNPLGPWLVPLDEISDVQSLRIESRVNGEARQESNTRDMIFHVGEIVHHLSQFMVLEPGDVINTGTPEGVALSGRFPYLKPGDEMEMHIEHLGTQRQRLVAAPRAVV